MKILSLDSSCEVLVVSLTRTSDTPVTERTLPSSQVRSVPIIEHREIVVDSGLRHVPALAPSVEYLLQQAETSASELDLVVCGAGPGSFTGLRTGLAYAKGLTAVGTPHLVLVPTLDTLAWSRSFFPGLVVPVIDARKKRVYTAVYRNGEKHTEDCDLTPEDTLQMIRNAAIKTGEDRVLITGPHAEAFFSTQIPGSPGECKFFLDPDARKGAGRAAAHLGLERFRRYGAAPPDAGPVYLRKSEAEIGITHRTDHQADYQTDR
jgi:tRNA threonylcarbamoyladenosine biosynthesis protein TsaB